VQEGVCGNDFSSHAMQQEVRSQSAARRPVLVGGEKYCARVEGEEVCEEREEGGEVFGGV
jgi:hypothetical protein